MLREDSPHASKVDAFLKELEEVCQRHGFSLSHEDVQGGFIVEKYHKTLSEWLQEASIGPTVRHADQQPSNR